MSEQYREDIAAAVARMGSKIGAGRELRDLESELHADERVIALVAGRHGAGNGVLALTGTRVLFLFEGLVRRTVVDIPIAEIVTVEWETGLNLGTLKLLAGGEVEVSGIDKDGGNLFVEALNEAKPTSG